jgi:hypothetical protein
MSLHLLGSVAASYQTILVLFEAETSRLDEKTDSGFICQIHRSTNKFSVMKQNRFEFIFLCELLRDVYTRVFCVRFSVRDGAAAQHFPLHDHIRDRARKAKEAVGQWPHHERRNGRKKRECRRPLMGQIHVR